MNSRQRATLRLIYANPTPGNILWKQIISLLKAPGVELDDTRSGSRVAIILNNRISVVHRPHPGSEVGRHTVPDIRDLLKDSGITP